MIFPAMNHSVLSVDSCFFSRRSNKPRHNLHLLVIRPHDRGHSHGAVLQEQQLDGNCHKFGGKLETPNLIPYLDID